MRRYNPRMLKPTAEQAKRAIDLAIGGMTQREIAQELGVHPTVIGKWKLANDVFAAELRHAQEEGSIARVDALRQKIESDPDWKRSRVIADVERWALERQFRKQWGQQLDLNVNERIDLNGALIDARKRVLLPTSNLAQLANAQDTEYTMVSLPSATDNESAALPEGMPNPFD
jgi:transposase